MTLGPVRDYGQRAENLTRDTDFAMRKEAPRQDQIHSYRHGSYARDGSKRPTKVLMLVSDVDLLTQLERLASLQDEFIIEQTEDAQRALALAIDGGFDLILIDVRFAEIGGHLMCRLLRSKGITYPLIMLSSSDSEADVILGFESGANDFVTGPLNINTFIARLRAHAQQSEKNETADFKFGPYIFHFADNSLVDSRLEKRIHLTSKEAMILRQLCRNKGNPVRRDELLRKVWNWDPTSYTHTLESHIYRLRKKLEPDPRRPVLIRSSAAGYQVSGET